MAYAALLSLARVLQQDLPHHQDSISPSDNENFETLHSNVVFLQEFLEVFSQNRSSSTIIKPLESRITDVAYHVEDIIVCEFSDRSYNFSDSSTCINDENGDARSFSLKRSFSNIGCCYKEVSSTVEDVVNPEVEYAQERSLRGMFSTFRSCIEEMNSIVEEVMNIKQNSNDQNKQVVSSTRISPITGLVTLAGSGKARKVVGLDTDLIQIKTRVIGYSTALQFIPIVGMGGIGKTTLARIVYEDQLIIDRFYIRSWVTVSQEYDAKKILLKILYGDKEEPSDQDAESLIVRVYQRLKGRRFILILDDMWDAAAWDCVRRAIPNDNNGSRIILTTRLVDVAAKVSSSCSHKMQLLNDDQAWALFQREVHGQDSCPPQLENIGRMIATKCKGLPLTIVVSARLLKLNNTQYYWENLAENINQATATHDDQLFAILSLSYVNLPPHLKSCFLYMSMFQEDEKIPSKKLIRLWVAEGFLKPTRGKTMEELAGEYLEDLVRRNLIFVADKSSNGKMRSCSIHDVLRELSIRKSKEEKFLQHFMHRYTDNSNLTTVYQRRFSDSTSGGVPGFNEPDADFHPVHSLLLPRYDYQNLVIEHFKLLVVLDAYKTQFMYNRVKVFSVSLINLRYLALSYSVEIDGLQLPSIFSLRNLETLILGPSHRMDPGPYIVPMTLIFPVQKLPKLKHFAVLRTHPARRKTNQIDQIETGLILSSLQTLSGLTNNILSAATVKSFVSLVKLKVNYSVDSFKELERFCLNNLVHLVQLENLNLTLRDYGSVNAAPLANVAFPHNLSKITLAACTISWKNMSVIGLLPKLEVLKLIQGCCFESGDWEPVDEEFQSLKYLKLGVGNLENWKVESTHFPRIEQLHFIHCHMLNEVPVEVGDMNTLKKLVVDSCPIRVAYSAMKIQEEQQGNGNDDELELVVLH